MPDLVTHVMAGYGLQRGLWPRLSPWFLAGAVLPDILTRPFTIIWPGSFWWTMPLHTPMGLLFVCAAIALVCKPGISGSVFLNLGAGVLVHLFLDLFQAHLAGSYYLLFPFSWRSVEVNLMWPETSLYLLPVWIAIGVWLGIREMRRRRAFAEPRPERGC